QEGEIGQLAHAIQGAFGDHRNSARTNGAAVRSLSAPQLAELPAEENDGEVVDHVEPEVATPASPRTRAPRKMRSPKLDLELHPEVEPSLKAYAEARNVTASASVLMKFLAIAAWLHEERAEMKINANRAFTCFRFMEWPFDINFYQPLADLRSKRDFLDLKSEDRANGDYTITHLGLARAAKMKTTS
ncbi:MAG: hypothetical protein WAV02_11365, partial [Stellaceae bacterium]